MQSEGKTAQDDSRRRAEREGAGWGQVNHIIGGAVYKGKVLKGGM